MATRKGFTDGGRRRAARSCAHSTRARSRRTHLSPEQAEAEAGLVALAQEAEDLDAAFEAAVEAELEAALDAMPPELREVATKALAEGCAPHSVETGNTSPGPLRIGETTATGWVVLVVNAAIGLRRRQLLSDQGG